MDKKANRLISLLLAILMTASLIPLSAVTASAAEVIDVYDASQLRAALQRDGTCEINVMQDIEYTLPLGFKWDYYNPENDHYVWANLGDGIKNLNLSGHRLYITDNFVETAEYRTETQYVPNTGKTEEVSVFVKDNFVQRASMFMIPSTSTLIVNGWHGEIMMDAQMPAREQMIDKRIVMQRDIFDVYGGKLVINGGEYQAGRKKEMTVSWSEKLRSDWECEVVAGTVQHYTGKGDYAINGTVINAYQNAVIDILSGDLIGYGYDVNSTYGFVSLRVCANVMRNGVIEFYNPQSELTIYDANVKAYCGADAVRKLEGGSFTIYAGDYRCEAENYYLWPYGYGAMPTESNMYTIPVDAGKPGARADTPDWCTLTSYDQRIIYAPTEKRISNGLSWQDGTSGGVYNMGSSRIAVYNAGDNYFDPPYELNFNNVEYHWALQKQNANGNWVSVTDWKSSVKANSIDISTLYSGWEKGAKYRLSVKRHERWSGTHIYSIYTAPSAAMVFTADMVTVDKVDLYVNNPVAGDRINSDPSSVYGVTDYVEIAAVKWYESGIEKNSGSFISGKTYIVDVYINAKNGATLDYMGLGSNATINGRKTGVRYDRDTQSYVLGYNFGMCANIIRSVEIKIDEPEIGAAADFYPQTASKTLITDVDPVSWMVSNTGASGSYKSMDPGDTFVSGKYYKVYIDITNYDGYEFALYDDGGRIMPDVTSYLNGRQADTIKAYDQDPAKVITVGYDFGKLTDNSISTVRVKGLIRPYPGEHPNYEAYADGTGYHVSEETSGAQMYGVTWYYEKNGQRITVYPEDVFKVGVNYTAEIKVIADSGKEFRLNSSGASQVSAYVNGYSATVKNGSAYSDKTKHTVVYSFNYAVAKVSDVAVNGFSFPKAGQSPDYLGAMLGSDELYGFDAYGYENCGMWWIDENGDHVDGGDTFEAGKSYTLEIHLVCRKDGSSMLTEFVTPVNATLNGMMVDPSDVQASFDKVIIRFDYTTDAGGSGGFLLGDVDGDNEVSILDATVIQRTLASLPVAFYNEEAADADGDGEVSILDATNIQRWLAGLSSNEDIGNPI